MKILIAVALVCALSAEGAVVAASGRRAAMFSGNVVCSGDVATGAVTAKVVVTNLTDLVQRISVSGTILDHAAGKTSLAAGARGVDGNDCNALNARNAAEGGVMISGYKAKLRPRAGRTIAIAETLEAPKGAPASYDMKLTLYDATGPCDTRTETFRFEELKGESE